MTTNIFRRMVLLLAAACVMTGVTLRPASAHTKFLDKTRFVGDVGVAYFVFHHWISGPYKQGAFAPGAPHRTSHIVKAGIALLFAYNRIKAASKIAHTSKDPLLHKLAGGIDAMGSSFSSIGSRFKGGHFNPSDISSLSNSYKSFDGSAMSNGLPIKDVSVPIPGA